MGEVIFGMSDDYTAFLEKTREVTTAAIEAMRVGLKSPPPVANDLRRAGLHYIEADKRLSEGDEEGASKELKEALRYACRASFDMLKFRFLFYSKFARSVIAELEEHKKLASQSILNYDEQSKKFPEVIKLIENAKSPSEDLPQSQASCEDVIKKLQEFLSNFKTKKGKLFPTIDTEPKTDSHEGLNNYDEFNYDDLKGKLFKKFEETEAKAKVAEQVAEKFPIHVAIGLYNGVACYRRADKEMLQGNEVGAINEMKEAIYYSLQAFFYALKLHLLGLLQKACDVCTQKIKGNKAVVLVCEPKYEKHFKNLGVIREIIENKEFPEEASVESQVAYSKEIEKLQEFLDDFEKDEKNLTKAIKDEQEAKNKAQEANHGKFFHKIERWWGNIKNLVSINIHFHVQ